MEKKFERSSIPSESISFQQKRNELFEQIKNKSETIVLERKINKINQNYCTVLIGKDSSEKVYFEKYQNDKTKQQMVKKKHSQEEKLESNEEYSMYQLIGLLEEYQKDKEMAYQLIFLIALLVIDQLQRFEFQECNGVSLVISIMKQYKEDIHLIRCCCSCLNNLGSFTISVEIISEIEKCCFSFPFDHFLQTVLCACYANFARFHSDSIIQIRSIEKMFGFLSNKNNPTDLDLSILAAFSNISRNSTNGQKQCVSLNIHEKIIDRMMNEDLSYEYWKVACNTLGCLSVNSLNHECKEVVQYAIKMGFVEKLVSEVHKRKRKDREFKDRLLTCLAKFCLVYPIFRIPNLLWLSYESLQTQRNDNENKNKDGRENNGKELFSSPHLIPKEIQKEINQNVFQCHVCQSNCDPLVFRSLRFGDSIILMSYCSLHCWYKRHDEK